MLHVILSLLKKLKTWLILVGVFLLYSSGSTLMQEKIAIDTARPIMQLFSNSSTGRPRPEVMEACIQEYQESEYDKDYIPLEYKDIVSLGADGRLNCDINLYTHSFKVSLFLIESAAVNLKVSLPYEYVKTNGFKEKSKPTSCVLRAQTLQAICPLYIKSHIKKPF